MRAGVISEDVRVFDGQYPISQPGKFRANKDVANTVKLVEEGKLILNKPVAVPTTANAEMDHCVLV